MFYAIKNKFLNGLNKQMRPYKFRAWDKVLNEWIDMSDIDIAFKQDMSAPGVWYVQKTIESKLVDNRNIVTMMYTGLHDDAQQEIVEGDICYAFKKGSGLNGYYKVVWDCIRGRWAYANGKVHEKYQVGKAGNIHCKIIGNAFENPTLDYMRKHN